MASVFLLTHNLLANIYGRKKITFFKKVKLMLTSGSNFSRALLWKAFRIQCSWLWKGWEKDTFFRWRSRQCARTHRAEGPDGVQVALIASVAQFGKCSQKSPRLRWLTPVVALQVASMCHDVDGCRQGGNMGLETCGLLLCRYLETQGLHGQAFLLWCL